MRAHLSALARQGKPITLAVFPATDHGIVEFEIDAAGARKAMRYAYGYFRMLVDWHRSHALDQPYGKAQVLSPPQRARAD